MWMNKWAVLVNILLGIGGFYVMAFVLITGGYLDVSPTPSICGYVVLALYLLTGILTNLYFVRRSSEVIKYMVFSVFIILVSFAGTILIHRVWG